MKPISRDTPPLSSLAQRSQSVHDVASLNSTESRGPGRLVKNSQYLAVKYSEGRLSTGPVEQKALTMQMIREDAERSVVQSENIFEGQATRLDTTPQQDHHRLGSRAEFEQQQFHRRVQPTLTEASQETVSMQSTLAKGISSFTSFMNNNRNSQLIKKTKTKPLLGKTYTKGKLLSDLKQRMLSHRSVLKTSLGTEPDRPSLVEHSQESLSARQEGWRLRSTQLAHRLHSKPQALQINCQKAFRKRQEVNNLMAAISQTEDTLTERYFQKTLRNQHQNNLTLEHKVYVNRLDTQQRQRVKGYSGVIQNKAAPLSCVEVVRQQSFEEPFWQEKESQPPSNKEGKVREFIKKSFNLKEDRLTEYHQHLQSKLVRNFDKFQRLMPQVDTPSMKGLKIQGSSVLAKELQWLENDGTNEAQLYLKVKNNLQG